jgi:hypothetical protein
MVWLYGSPIPAGRRGIIPHSNDFYLPSLRAEEGGGGVSTLCVITVQIRPKLQHVFKGVNVCSIAEHLAQILSTRNNNLPKFYCLKTMSENIIEKLRNFVWST